MTALGGASGRSVDQVISTQLLTIGAESTLWPHTTLRGDDGAIVVGARSNIQDGTVVHCTEDQSVTTVGDYVTVGHNVTLHGAPVADYCLIGMGSIVLDNAEIGHHSVVGAGALVTGGVVIPPYSLVLGSPARVVRQVTERELHLIEYGWRRYVEQARIYKARLEGS